MERASHRLLRRPQSTAVDDETRTKIVAALNDYAEQLSPSYRFMLRRYGVADIAHRVVGVGSVGTRAYLALLFGKGDDDPLFVARCCRARTLVQAIKRGRVKAAGA